LGRSDSSTAIFCRFWFLPWSVRLTARFCVLVRGAVWGAPGIEEVVVFGVGGLVVVGSNRVGLGLVRVLDEAGLPRRLGGPKTAGLAGRPGLRTTGSVSGRLTSALKAGRMYL
jgi:hypothetical protein